MNVLILRQSNRAEKGRKKKVGVFGELMMTRKRRVLGVLRWKSETEEG